MHAGGTAVICRHATPRTSAFTMLQTCLCRLLGKVTDIWLSCRDLNDTYKKGEE